MTVIDTYALACGRAAVREILLVFLVLLPLVGLLALFLGYALGRRVEQRRVSRALKGGLA